MVECAHCTGALLTARTNCPTTQLQGGRVYFGLQSEGRLSTVVGKAWQGSGGGKLVTLPLHSGSREVSVPVLSLPLPFYIVWDPSPKSNTTCN